MSLLWDLYWPAIVAAAVAGVIAGAFGFRRKKRGRFSLAAGIAATLLLAWIWHGPVGTGDRFVSAVERQTRQVLADWEMAPVRAVVARDPVKRTLILSGPGTISSAVSSFASSTTSRASGTSAGRIRRKPSRFHCFWRRNWQRSSALE